MAIITLTSDWGLANHYAGAVKGALLREIPGATIVDISHRIACFDIMQASFILRNSAFHFPEGTIHLVGVNTEAGIKTPHIALLYQGHYFIGADNGIFSLMCDTPPDEMVELDIRQETDYFTFSTRDVFVKAASMILKGKSLAAVGSPHSVLYEKFAFRPVVNDHQIVGKVIFIDHYENVFVNIDKEVFKKVGRGRPFSIQFRSPDDGISRLHEAYSDVMEGERLALFGSSGYLEVAINQGKAASLLGLNMSDSVSIHFENT